MPASASPALAAAREGGTSLAAVPSGAERAGPARGPGSRAPVFYNPAMAIDRDLGVAFARALRSLGSPRLRAWEMLAATGVRSIRVGVESDLFRSLVATEAHPAAFEALCANLALHPGLPSEARAADARRPPAGGPFGYVDLDPYGSPLPFLDAAFAAAETDGVVAVTATDLAVLAGAQAAACRRRYGAEPVRGPSGPEGAVRILLRVLAEKARARGRGVRPLLSYVLGHHVRACVALTEERRSADPIGRIDPATWDGPPVGTGGPYGPMWLGPLSDPRLVAALAPPPAAARPREVARFIARLQEEIDRPFSYDPNELARELGLARPPPVGPLIGALRASGARASRSHHRPNSLRTDAPRSTVHEVARRLAGAP